MRRLAAVLGVLALACQEPFEAPPDLSPTLSSRELWSGGEARITDSALANVFSVLRVVLDDDTLVPQLVDDTTLLVRLPRRAGTFSLRLAAGGKTAALLGNVTLHGYHSGSLGPFWAGQPYWLPAGAPLVFVAADRGAAIFDLRSGSPVVSVHDSIHSRACIMSVGPTSYSNRFVLLGRSASGVCGSPKLWTISSHPQLLDTFPQPGFPWYTSGQPAEKRWVFNRNNANHFYNCETGSCLAIFFNSADGPNGVTISPRGDRFLWEPAWRAMVFDSRTLDTAFVLPEFQGLHAAFSLDGDTLALVGTITATSAQIVRARATDGTILDRLSLDSVFPGVPRLEVRGIQFDPTRPWLYALVSTVGYEPEFERTLMLVVVDRTSWSILGVLKVPPEAPFTRSAVAIVPSPLERLVYVVSATHGEEAEPFRSAILRFTTP